ncbi:putative disease resistance protein RGA3 [Quercus robur]|uniref:putative disease resistance protein RGA3 n=1 Tax=Quercus robur TaxID=38942 RepID=UPI002162B4DA|nr:putative disease resistance protein RGA3 [Quercus robur]XP_050285987.1 putative disease resistance protein RGA3 [Quercus robur]XP_050285988.1 putative disease resistance protein RGA3 [Quercus robur]XP_050285989.1 putative disease resistance protein RGA3 [Quercus robur]XP_050285990.1 putative disease resistance protein RGA3 [Quercus robur]XP_050285992.1 putative disease resistance protein RGA3 [Quercus robur]XP_050285993.1 putative disease resistance protein RGA3 [Quercus robur]XP_05028599
MTAIVSGLLEKSGSLLAEEVWPELKSFLCFQNEVRKLQSTLRAIQAVLEDADKRQLKEEAVKLWLDKLKEAAYDVDNVLDEVETAIIKAKIEEEEEKAETTTATAKVWSSCTTCISWIFRVVTELVQRGFIVFKIKNLNETLDEIDKEKGRYNFVSGPITSPEVGERLGTYSRVDVKEIHGRDKYRDDLVRMILGEGSEMMKLSGEGSEVRGSEGERSPYVISIVGMGGIGKTTLAKLAYAKVQTKLAYNDTKVQTALFDEKLWVCVSNPFDERRVAKAIIKGCRGSTNSNELEELLNEMCELIRGKKLLLVLDDVWTEEFNHWKPFKLALECGDLGSRILITTRSIRVAEMVKSAYTIRLDVLSDEDCWLICSQMAYIEKDDEQLGELGRELAKKCKGLPLAAETLGSLMRNKRSKEEWRDKLDSNLWKLENVRKGLLGPLLLSYYEQPLAIKSCFLYCALFPKDYIFSRNELIHLWMSQGYLGINPEEMENIGEEYFEILVMRSFFQDFEKDNDNDKIITCKIHDIVHDFAQSMASKECFTIDGDKELGTNCRSACHLRLELIGETQFPMSICNAKNVRTLFFAPLNKRIVFPLNLSQHLTCLRALTLKWYSFEILPNEVEKLIHLRLLDLSENHNIKELAETMCNLCNLQTLNISGCGKITKLPQGMGKLIKLRHLLIGDCYKLTEPFPKGIGRLSSLRTLEKFIIGSIDDIDGCKLGELKNLNHLKGSLMIKGLKNVTDVQEAENAQLKDKKYLRELGLSFDRRVEEIERVRNDEIVLKALEPHSNLEILKIDKCMGRVYPNWMNSLSNLKRLHLWCWPNLEQLPPLGKLQFLETLVLRDAYSVKKVGVEFLGIEEANGKNGSTSPLVLFPNLKSLEFGDMKEWEEWDGIGERREEEGESGVSVLISIMPRLQFLDIWRCPKLKALPNFLETTSLKQLEVDCRISNWMTLATLPGLKTLCLGLNNDVEHLPPLGKLLLVESLEIYGGAERVKKVGVEFLGIEEESNNNKKKIDDEKGSTSSSSSSSLVLFPNLKSLSFWGLKEWEEWDGIGGTMREEEAQESGVAITITIMPRLQSLTISDCPKLKSLPDFLPTTPLKTLKIITSPILSECCKTEIGDQWPKISHIPNILIDHTWVRRDGHPMQN